MLELYIAPELEILLFEPLEKLARRDDDDRGVNVSQGNDHVEGDIVDPEETMDPL